MKKLLKNIISSTLPQIVNIISNLILPALIIESFGSDINGLVSTTKTVVSYISLVGAGIATAVTQSLYQPVASKNDSVVKGMLKAANSMFNHYGLLFVALTIVISVIYPLIIGSDIPYGTVAGILIVMSISGASEFFAIGRCRAILYAHQKVYVCSVIQAMSLLASLVVAVILLHIDVSIIWVQFAISCVYILRGVFLSSYVKNTYPQYSDYKSATPIPAAVEKRKDAMIHQLAGLAVTGSQSVILTLLVDLKAASIYSVYNIVLYGIRNICANLCTSISPFMGKKYALNQKEGLKQLYDAVELVFFLFATFVLMVTVVMLVPFVSLYTDGADLNYVHTTFALLFVVSSLFYILKLPGTALINVAGHFKETRWRAVIEALLSVVLSVIFTMWLGKEGVLVGTGVALGWRCIDTILYSSKFILQCSPLKSIMRLAISFGNVFAFKLISLYVNISIGDWSTWVIYSTAFSLLAFFLLVIEAFVFEYKSLKNIWLLIKQSKITD